MCTALGVEWASPHRSESQDGGCRLCVQPWGWSGRHLIVVKARMTECRLCSLGMKWACIVKARMTDQCRL